MRLNHTLGELNNNNFVQYGEWLYWITVMGEPSATEPWGWQLDGHHVIINYFVLGDQVVMTPTFIGSEPVIATTGKYAGTSILQDEQNQGLAFVNASTPPRAQGDRRSRPRPATTTSPRHSRTTLCSPTRASRRPSCRHRRRTRCWTSIGQYVGNMDDGHAKVKMEEVKQHLDDTHFAWIGGTAPDAFSITASTAP